MIKTRKEAWMENIDLINKLLNNIIIEPEEKKVNKYLEAFKEAFLFFAALVFVGIMSLFAILVMTCWIWVPALIVIAGLRWIH